MDNHFDNRPLVTIGIPNYNYSHYVINTIESAVNQTYSNIEVIIVDDCSTDNSVEVIEEWIKEYKGPVITKFIKNVINLGLSANCNIILKNSKGKYFQPLDADDWILPDKIAKQVSLLERSENTAMVYSNSSVINEEGKITNPDYCARIHYDRNKMPQGKIKKDLLTFNFISLPSVLINTQYAREVGGFDDTLQVQDYYLWLKLSERYDVIYTNEILAHYRVHESSMSNNSFTSPNSTDSVLRIKYNYYNDCNPSLKKIISRNIQFGAVYLYQYKHLAAKKWLTIAFFLNPGFKTFLYFLSIRIGIPFSFYEKIKSLFKN